MVIDKNTFYLWFEICIQGLKKIETRVTAFDFVFFSPYFPSGKGRKICDLWFVRLKGFIRHWRRCQVFARLCTGGAISAVYRTRHRPLIHSVHSVSLDTGPHPGATINIQVGSSLTKGGGGQTKNSGKLLLGLNISSRVLFFEYPILQWLVTIVEVSWKHPTNEKSIGPSSSSSGSG